MHGWPGQLIPIYTVYETCVLRKLLKPEVSEIWEAGDTSRNKPFVLCGAHICMP